MIPRKSSPAEPALTAVDIRRIEASHLLARMAHASCERHETDEALMRKEMLTGTVIGLVGLLAPFVFLMLFHSGK